MAVHRKLRLSRAVTTAPHPAAVQVIVTVTVTVATVKVTPAVRSQRLRSASTSTSTNISAGPGVRRANIGTAGATISTRKASEIGTDDLMQTVVGFL